MQLADLVLLGAERRSGNDFFIGLRVGRVRPIKGYFSDEHIMLEPILESPSESIITNVLWYAELGGLTKTAIVVGHSRGIRPRLRLIQSRN